MADADTGYNFDNSRRFFFYFKLQHLRRGLPDVVLVKRGCQGTPRFFTWGCECLNSWNSPGSTQPPRNDAFFGIREMGNWFSGRNFSASDYSPQKNKHTCTQSCAVKQFSINQKEFLVFWNADLLCINFFNSW